MPGCLGCPTSNSTTILGIWTDFRDHYGPRPGSMDETYKNELYVEDFVIEESELYLPNISLAGVDKDISRLILQGRNRGIGIMAVTHSLSDFSKPFFKACKNVFIFYLFSPNDITYLRGFMGPEAAQIRNLPPYHFAHFSQGTTTLCAPIPYP